MKSAYSIYVAELDTRVFAVCYSTAIHAVWVDVHLIATDTVMICIMSMESQC